MRAGAFSIPGVFFSSSKILSSQRSIRTWRTLNAGFWSETFAAPLTVVTLISEISTKVQSTELTEFLASTFQHLAVLKHIKLLHFQTSEAFSTPMRILLIFSLSYPPPQFKQRAKSFPVPIGRIATGGRFSLLFSYFCLSEIWFVKKRKKKLSFEI